MQEKVTFKVDASNRIGVPPIKWADAIDAIAKHGAEPYSLEKIDREPPTADPWSSPQDRLAKQQWQEERRLEAMVENYLDGGSAHVSIIRSTIKSGLRPKVEVSATVQIDAQPRPRHTVISAIQTLLSTSVESLRAEDITISDRQGHFYTRKGDPSAASQTQSMARGEELRDLLLEKLGPIIPGIDVVVQVEPPTLAEPVADPAHAHRASGAENANAAPAFPVADAMKPNHPIGLENEQDAAIAAKEIAATEPHAHQPPQALALPALPTVGRAQIWVQVPRSYYLKIFRETHPTKNPSREDLTPFVERTEDTVEGACAVLVPTAERGLVKVTMALDDLGASAPIIMPAGATDTVKNWPAWAPVAALGASVGVAVSLALMTAFGMLNSRRPEVKPARTRVRSGLSVDAPSGPVPAPSERVRDLVRRNPEAAAGVLQRWIGQGEGGAVG